MKIAPVCFVFIMSAVFGFSQEETGERKIEILPQSSISIYGDAKIADFTCNFNMDHLQVPDAISYNKTGSQLSFQDAELVLRNRGFDCGRKSRNEDFHEMVKTEEYSEMKLDLKKAVLNDDKSVNATVDIFIAGKENTYTIPLDITRDRVPRFRGTFQINIRDFGLEPITKMFGLIRVQDIIEINLDLAIRY